MPYRLAALAERDLGEIWSYVAEDASPTTADRLIDAIIDDQSSAKAFDRSASRTT